MIVNVPRYQYRKAIRRQRSPSGRNCSGLNKIAALWLCRGFRRWRYATSLSTHPMMPCSNTIDEKIHRAIVALRPACGQIHRASILRLRPRQVSAHPIKSTPSGAVFARKTSACISRPYRPYRCIAASRRLICALLHEGCFVQDQDRAASPDARPRTAGGRHAPSPRPRCARHQTLHVAADPPTRRFRPAIFWTTISLL